MPIQLLITRLHRLAVHVYCSEVLQATYMFGINTQLAMILDVIYRTWERPCCFRWYNVMIRFLLFISLYRRECSTFSSRYRLIFFMHVIQCLIKQMHHGNSSFKQKKHAGQSLCKLGAATCICESFCAACLANHI